MKINSTYATQDNLKWLKEKDQHIDVKKLKNKISAKEILVIKADENIVGWLRFGLFWDEIPFINMLFVEEEYRNKGIGKKLVKFWETSMKKKKYKIVMTSSQSDEEAQHFYRKLGYTDAGSLTIPKEPLEVIFIKKL